MYKGRTVALFVVVAVLASSILTMTLTGNWNFARSGVAGSGSYASTAGQASKEDMSKIETALNLVKNNYVQNVDQSKLVDGAINGIMGALDDPFSSYMGKTTAEQFTSQIQGSFSGIGAEVSMENGNVVVVSPIKGSPAEKAGIHAKDILLSVNGESFEGLGLNEAVAKIRGKKGTIAKVKVKRAGNSAVLEFAIKRDDIAMETVNAHMDKNKIGYIEITEFSLNTGERFKKELESLENQGMKGLVIDVRNNPGGVLSVVIDMAQRMIGKDKIIVQVEDKKQQREKTLSKGTAKDYPIAVLTNKGSASASEILAGALQESANAKLIGDTTYGKGTVQTSFEKELGDGSLLKITIAKWLTPKGEWIHKKGIKPDIAVAQPAYFAAAPINKEKTWKYDMNDDNIKNAQVMLDGLGFAPGRKDGYFDTNTLNAVKSFQKSNTLTVTGEIDSKTAEALEKNLITHIRDPKNDVQLNRAFTEVEKEITAR
ncbi:carboxyl-terminal processing protease [Paenibacillus shirakamiensis]|uniref:Carboxyl-terminal processing protease n=1 Tax=Paenibacillus shirakamiensis TaxID=1265935 RepID=A0ABS4JJ74_9BACL|nr:S41 family peptidase [Paenibacillus shirakamiensis]MBP2001747.1 carboxyl-terminal processing protease [Paenibacillus shirakamiensis]